MGVIISQNYEFKQIKDWCFDYPEEDLDIIISKNLRMIPEYAFCKCRNIKSIILEENSQLRVIGKFAFSGTSLSKINLENARYLSTIYEEAFSQCEHLSEFYADSDRIDFFSFCFCNCYKDFTLDIGHSNSGYTWHSFSGIKNLIIKLDPDKDHNGLEEATRKPALIYEIYHNNYISKEELCWI